MLSIAHGRRQDNPRPIRATLTVDETTGVEDGTISRDLFERLFGRQAKSPVVSEKQENEIYKHVAITPWRQWNTQLVEDGDWIIISVKVRDDDEASKITVPPGALQGKGGISDLRSSTKLEKEVWVPDVKAISLDMVIVRVDAESVRQHEEVQRRFGGGFGGKTNGGTITAGKGRWKEVEARLKKAVKSAIEERNIIRSGDSMNLPLPAHPITHVAFPPVEVLACDPVEQGVMKHSTRVVIDIDYRKRKEKNVAIEKMAMSGMVEEEEAEDTTAEQFFSAAEGSEDTHGSFKGAGSVNDVSSTEESSSDEDSLSDDSVDNMISLTTPVLHVQPSGTISSRTAATPRPIGFRSNGIATPGSVYSNYTATTARQGGPISGRMFELKALLTKVPDSVLYPKPSDDEDDEARVFVDMKMLVRLGCFSGDWVKLAIVPKQSPGRGQTFDLAMFGDEETTEEFRSVKIYGLPDIGGTDVMQYPKTESTRRQSSSSILPMTRPKPIAYVSPILFSNLGQPSTITLAPLLLQSHQDKRFSKPKLPSTAVPPIAKELKLKMLQSPLSTEKAVQAGLFTNLKQYFEHRRRILRKGDLVAISLDVNLSRLLSDTDIPGEPGNEIQELFGNMSATELGSRKDIGVAWFIVDHISKLGSDEYQPDSNSDSWGQVASTEPMTTRMAQTGLEQGRVPPALEVPWEHYLGVKKCPKAVPGTTSALATADSLSKPFISSARRRIRELVASATSHQAITYRMDPVVLLLHSTQRGIGKASLTSAACSDLGLHIFPIDSYDILTEGAGGGDKKSEAFLQARIELALRCGAKYVVPMICHVEALTAERMASTIKNLLKELRILVMTTTELEKIPENVRGLVTNEIEISAPDEREREGILNDVVNEQSIRLSYDVDLSAVAVKTAALVAGDLVDVVERAVVARQVRLEALSAADSGVLVRDVLVSGGANVRSVTKADFDIAVDAARKNFADSIGAPKIPNVSWDDVGGLANVKDAVMETIQLPLERPELFAKGMKKRSGILFYGPPGTGKTLLAKAIATEFSLNFFSVKGPELLNMYIGESEANVRRVFQRARDARPCVVFFDELDSVAPKRGNQGDSGGVMDRIVSQLLAELDGMSGSDGGSGGVFVIGATNRPDLLDQALLRPGRFDKMLYLGVSDTHDKQLTILEALTRKFVLHPELSLRRVAECLPFTYTGADLYALSSDAMLKAITRQASAVDAKIRALPDGPVTAAHFFDHYATKDDIAVMVTEEDFSAARQELVGSVSAKELEHYKRVRETFEGKPVNKSSPTAASQLLLSPRVHSQVAKPRPKVQVVDKGKGRAAQWDPSNEEGSSDDPDDEDDDDDDDDDAYVTSNDYGTPKKYRDSNGSADIKGKGKANAWTNNDGFGDAAEDDESELYG